MKKTFQWLDDNAIAYDFHDYKKIGVDDEFLTRAIEQHGWETIINKRGTTWRKLSIIKRPLIEHSQGIIVGFDDEAYKILKH